MIIIIIKNIKKINRIKELSEQEITNYWTLNIWFWNCENYFANNFKIFLIKMNKIYYVIL